MGDEHTLKRYKIMVAAAWAWYNNSRSLHGMIPRAVIPLPKLYDVMDCLGRSLWVSEVQTLIAVDGGVVVCDQCGKGFQPVRFVLMDDAFLRLLVASKDIAVASRGSQWGGNFYPDGGVVKSACGAHYYFFRSEVDGTESYELNKKTCAGKMCLGHGEDPLLTFTDAKRQAEVEAVAVIPTVPEVVVEAPKIILPPGTPAHGYKRRLALHEIEGREPGR